jgi:putative polyketide hydroxylase
LNISASFVLTEKHPGSSAHPRAIGYTVRTLELFRTVGLTLPPSHGGKPRRARVESLAGQWYEEYPWSPAAAAKPDIEYSPCTATAIAQGADVRMNTELISLTQEHSTQDDDGVTASTDVRPVQPAAFRTAYGLEPGGATLVRRTATLPGEPSPPRPTPREH